MTTILAAAAVVMFAILIGVCVFGFLRLYALLKEDDQKDEVKAQPGKYRNIADFDVTSMHPSSCISEKLNEDKKQDDTFFRVRMLEFRARMLEDKLDDITEQTLCLNPDCNSLYSRIEKLEKLVQQLYTDRDEDVNEIADQINRHEKLVLQLYTVIEDVAFMKNDYEKRFENLSELSKDYTESLQSINDRLDRIEIDKQNNEEKAEWLYENVEEDKNE